MIEKVVKLYNEGYREIDIASKFDVPLRTIQTILAQQGQYLGGC